MPFILSLIPYSRMQPIINTKDPCVLLDIKTNSYDKEQRIKDTRTTISWTCARLGSIALHSGIWKTHVESVCISRANR